MSTPHIMNLTCNIRGIPPSYPRTSILPMSVPLPTGPTPPINEWVVVVPVHTSTGKILSRVNMNWNGIKAEIETVVEIGSGMPEDVSQVVVVAVAAEVVAAGI